MKFPLWTLSLPIIALSSVFQLTFDLAEQGRLDSTFFRQNIYPLARSINGTMTDIKFRLRGEIKPKNKIVIVAADDKSLDVLGRWPWHREIYAQIIHSTFKLGAKSMGMDVTFSEPEERIPEDVYKIIAKEDPKILDQIKSYEGDPLFAEVTKAYQKRLVLGHASTVSCQPRYDSAEACPINDEALNKVVNDQLSKFALAETIPLSREQLSHTPLSTILSSIANIPPFYEAALYSGNFNINLDPDGYVRRYPLFDIHQNQMFPSLALKLAELAKDDSLHVDFTPDARVEKVYFSHTPDDPVPATRLGYLDLNFRGKAESFPYVSAIDVLRAVENPNPAVSEMLQDSVALFGATALGIYDMRAFPFDSNTPGVEGHATALDKVDDGFEG